MEHPFAQYVRILGKGPHLSRPLTRAESRAAAGMVLDGAIEPIQLGAFLCLLRVKTETAEEVAGFVDAVQERLPPAPAGADLDWSSYAGKSRRLPWFLLSALLLAESGVRVLMHGSAGHTQGRLYSGAALAALGLPVAGSLAEAADHLAARRFAYLPLEAFSPRLQALMALRPLLGVRSPIHTIARMVNPLRAPCQLLSVFHPNYRAVHQEAAHLLGQERMAVFKGEGGEIERRPEKPCLVLTLEGDAMRQQEWPALPVEPPPHWDDMEDVGRLAALWSGDWDDDYAAAIVAGTAAIALALLGRAGSIGEAETLARRLWHDRRRDRLGGADRA